MSKASNSPEVLERFESALELVNQIAGRMRRTAGRNMDYDDLVSLGREGLLGAARRFDADRGVPFRGYATFRIRGAMIDGIRAASPLPRGLHQQLQLLEAADRYGEGVAEDVNAPPPTGESKADAQKRLDEHLAGIATAMAAGLILDSPEDPAAPEGWAPGASPEVGAHNAELRVILTEAIEQLTEQEAELVRRIYLQGHLMQEVADTMGISKSWGSRLHSKALRNLAKLLKRKI